jgi:hypothetical protein
MCERPSLPTEAARWSESNCASCTPRRKPLGFLLALGRDVGNAPQDEFPLRAAAFGTEGVHGRPHGSGPAARWSFLLQRKLFGERVAALGGARQAKERGARPRLSCEQLLERAQLVGTRAADDRLERLVGVDGFALRGRDHHPCIESVRGRRHDLCHGHPLGQVPGREREQEEQPRTRARPLPSGARQAGTACNEGGTIAPPRPRRSSGECRHPRTG